MNHWRQRMLQILLVLVGILALLSLLGRVGLQIEPAPFPAISQAQPQLETVPLPQGLPAPVVRFYRQTYGENIP